MTDSSSGNRTVYNRKWLGVDVVLFREDPDGEADLDGSNRHDRNFSPPQSKNRPETSSIATPTKSIVGATGAFVDNKPNAEILEPASSVKQKEVTRKDVLLPVCLDWRRGDEIRRLEIPTLDQIKSWDFDVLAFSKPTLIPVVEQMLDFLDIYETFHINRQIMNIFITDIMTHYHPDDSKGHNDYHNWYHAVSTMHISFLFIIKAGARCYLTDCEVYALLMGALAHDVCHTGQSNDFHVKIKTDLAMRYNDESVLENHSITRAQDIWENHKNVKSGNDNKCTILSGCNDKDKRLFKEFFHHVILHTDPSKHGDMMNQLANIVSERVNQKIPPFDSSSPSHRKLLGEMIVHASDISATCGKNFEVVKDWCQRVIMEFKQQALLEREVGVEVTAYMDGLDSKVKVANLQADFCAFMVLPLFQLISLILPEASSLEMNLDKNIFRYRNIVDEKEES